MTAVDPFSSVLGSARGVTLPKVSVENVPERLWPRCWQGSTLDSAAEAFAFAQAHRGPGSSEVAESAATAVADAALRAAKEDWLDSLAGALGLLDPMSVLTGEDDSVWHLVPDGHLHPPALEYNDAPPVTLAAECGLQLTGAAYYLGGAPGDWALAQAGKHPTMTACPGCAPHAARYSDAQVQPGQPEQVPVLALRAWREYLDGRAQDRAARLDFERGDLRAVVQSFYMRLHADLRPQVIDFFAGRMVELRSHATLGLLNRPRDPARHPELAHMRRAVADDSLFEATITHADWFALLDGACGDPFNPIAFTDEVHSQVLNMLGDRI